MVKIRVIVNGCVGRMGQEVVRAVHQEKDMEIAGAVDTREVGVDVGMLCGLGPLNIEIGKDLAETIKETKAQVVVDFTHPNVVMENIKTIIKEGARPVVGTTGIAEANLKEIKKLCEQNKTSAIIAPNFAIGAVLMMRFAKEAARHLRSVEVIELHHDQKADAPSGTAIKTAEMIEQELAAHEPTAPAKKVKEIEKVAGARGGKMGDVHIHSVRLPGLVAHQEVIFGGVGQTLSIRHDSISRESFMPGVILAIRKALEIKGLVYGLEHLL